ncbi:MULTISPECIES: SPOR domain-containing protein [Sphingomonas]|jgi:tetratricopeptide (TPR) repeat protein|uniref:SPOR domain-containing protein n=1 Tax=Sphingomonas TaxID=13687 RepID=UPI001AE79FDF
MRIRLASSMIALAACGTAAHAQTAPASPYPTAPYPTTVQPLSDADLLASEIRALAADPNNLQALVRAGELALKLGDDTAAAAFFARAERIDPRNARVKAGEGALLVAAERPGDALRHFAEAEALGGDARTFAADRGLAYDLVGEQERAQREYRLALKAGANEETQRRYALSLGISGKRELALAQIEPLLRKSDRGAWRARAFILAMAGDKAGAEKIATSMMPTGMAQGLQPFFEILPGLRPADRAFAVHFGEVRPSPERLADARMVPPLAALGPDPTAPVAVAAVAKPVVAADAREERRKARKAHKDQGRSEVAVAAIAAPTPPAQLVPPAYAAPPASSTAVLASNTVRLPVTPPATTLPHSTVSAPSVTAAQGGVPVRTAPPQPQSPVLKTGTVPAVAINPVAQANRAAMPTASQADGARFAAPPAAVPQQSAHAAIAPVAAQAPTQTITPTPPRPAPTPVRSEESILAAIISEIKVPGAETQNEVPAPAAAPAPARQVPVAQPVVEPQPAADRERQMAADKQAAEKQAADRRAADKKAAAEKKALADKKAAADKKIADAKKAAADKKAAEEKKKKDPKFLEPARVWVQVAGGANVGDLPKQWTKIRAKAAKAFGGKSAWTTPLRATNRLLTGPFKSEDEAQRFVNDLAKDDISGFVFVSEAGQKISKLPAK